MPNVAAKRLSTEEFFIWQQGQEERYELVEGVPLARDRVSLQHDRIVGNVIAGLGRELAGTNFWVATAGLPVRTKRGTLRRADAKVTTVHPRSDAFEAQHVVGVIEVSSFAADGNAGARRIDEYRLRDDVRFVLLIDQGIADGALLFRDGGCWVSTGFVDRSAVIELPEMGCRLDMASVYKGVSLAGPHPLVLKD